MKQCNDMGMSCCNGSSLLNYNYWDNYKENTYYEYYVRGICYSDLKFFKEEKYKIIEWEIEENINAILQQSLNSPTLSEVEQNGIELKSIKLYEYNDEKYIIVKKDEEIVKFDKYEE